MPNPGYDHYVEWRSGGALVSVGRNCAPGQSNTECTEAFNEAVAALKEIYPED